jgi:hypothetical protein
MINRTESYDFTEKSCVWGEDDIGKTLTYIKLSFRVNHSDGLDSQ